MNTPGSVTSETIERRYAKNRDAWEFAKSSVELERYQSLIKTLRRRSYGTVYEPGCSTGVLTEQLAAIATRVVATDFAPTAVEQARSRCATCDNVEILCADIATYAPPSPLDLIVFGEVGYYCSRAQLCRIANRLARSLAARGEFIAVHWLGTGAEGVLHADQVYAVLDSCLNLKPLKVEFHPGFPERNWQAWYAPKGRRFYPLAAIAGQATVWQQP